MTSRFDIETTLYRCARGFDEDDIDLLTDCFTADAELTSFKGTTTGRDAIREAMLEGQVEMLGQGKRPRHLLTNIEVAEESPTVVETRAYFAMLTVEPDGAIIIAAKGVYVDRMAQESGAWRISRRRVYIDGHED